MSGYFPPKPPEEKPLEFEKDIDVYVDYDYDSDVEIDFDKDVKIDVCVDSYVDVEGNFAQITFDAEAVGKDTLVEADLIVLTIEDELSMVAGTITSAVG